MKTTLTLLFMLTAALLAGQPAFRDDQPHFYGLIIGVSDYPGKEYDLQFCASDAVRLAANLQGCVAPLYLEANTHIKLLSTDADSLSADWPNKENIQAAFRDIAAKIRPQDVFFLFFASHAIATADSLTKQFYFLLPDFPNSPYMSILGTAPEIRPADTPFTISSADLFEWLGAIRTNKKVIINDCARSGQMIVDYKKTIPDHAAITNAYPGMYMLTGAQQNGLAFEANSIGGGLMTYCFNTVLSGKSLIGSTVISQLESKPVELIDINTAFHYTYLLTQEVSKEIGRLQVPMIYLSPSSESFDLGFVNDTITLSGKSDQSFVEWYLNVNLLQEAAPAVKSTARPLNLIIPNGHSRAVSTFDYSPDSLYLLTGSADKTARLWDRARNEIVVYRGHSGAIEEVAFAGGGQRVLTRSSDGTVKLWTLEGREIVSLDKVNDMAVTSDGRFFLTSGNSFNSTLRDLEGKPVGAPLQHPSVVTKVAVSGNGDRFLTYGLDNTAILWDGNGHQIVSLEIGRVLRSDQQFHFSKDGNYIFCGTVYGPGVYNGKIWNSAGEVLVQEDQALFGDKKKIPLSNPLFIGKITLKIDAAVFEIWQTTVNPRLFDLSDETGLKPTAESGSKRTICFSPNGGNPVLFSMGKTAYLWDLTTNIRTPLTGINSNVLSTAVAPDGRTFLTAEEDGRISLWDIEGQGIGSFGLAEKIKKIRFSPDGRQILAVCAKNVFQLTLEGQKLHTFNLTDSPILDADVAPDGTSILLGGLNEAVLKGATETTVLGWERDSILPDQFGFSAVAVSPDGAAFLTANGVQGTARLSNLPDPVLKIKLPFAQAAFSAEGQYILLGSGNLNLPGQYQDFVQPGVGYLLSQDGRLLHMLKGHTEPITALGFHPNRRHVYTVSADGTIKFWDIQSGEEVGTFIPLNATDWVVTSPSGLFDASPGAMRSMYFVFGLEIIELEQFKTRYYEPGLLAKILGNIPGGLRPVDAMSNLELYPKIRAASIENDRLRVQLEERDGGIGDVVLLLNDNIQLNANINPGFKPAFEADLKPYAHYFSTDTINRLSLLACNRAGWLNGQAYRLNYRPTEIIRERGNSEPNSLRKTKDAPLDSINLYALIVGTSRYSGEHLKLNYPDKDAQAFADALRLCGEPLFGKNIEVKLLSTNAEPWPRKAEIRQALQAFAAKADPNDILLVYLSGHGITYPPNSEKGQFYYLTTDIVTDDLKDPAVRNEKAIAQDSLQAWINQVTARKRILILDACNSGQVVKTMGPGEKALNSDQRRALERMKDRSGMFVLAGSAADKSSFEASRFGHGLLTYSLLNNMPKVAAENKALIDVGQLFTEALEEVPKLAKDIGRAQTPELIGAGSFDIGMIKGAPPFAIPQTIPVFLRTNFTNKKSIDLVGLSRAVNSRLEFLAGQKEPALAYWDLVEFPGDHYYLGGSYEQVGEAISGESWLYREDKELTSFKFSGSATRLDALAEQILDQAFIYLNKKK
ncbi:MAG: caspase family protein [Lewinellaceae bacterium]|nr:caspase family protein [Saprospiraceae bacterium]MCB9331357.1 caspase family protein [Lewinellaceae bacterium]